MKLTNEQKQELENLYQSFFHDPKIERMKDIPMHRGSNCFIHSFSVAKLAIKRALRHKNVNLHVILLGAILHDYYLYDWRTEKEKKKHHCKNHPNIASMNAERDFKVVKEVKKIIESHMWPLNWKSFPDTTEARIVSLADKHVASKEAATSIQSKANRKDEIMKSIEKLFD